MTAAATDYRTDAIADGYVYECSCGELYNSVYAADTCRKCRNYCVFGYCTHVVDIRTGEVVAGEEPTAEAYAEAQKRAEAEWAAEQAAQQSQHHLPSSRTMPAIRNLSCDSSGKSVSMTANAESAPK